MEGQCERYDRTWEESRILKITSSSEKDNLHKVGEPEVQLDGDTASRPV